MEHNVMTGSIVIQKMNMIVMLEYISAMMNVILVKIMKVMKHGLEDIVVIIMIMWIVKVNNSI